MTGASAPSLEEVAWAKQVVRERAWALLEREGWPASRAPRVAMGGARHARPTDLMTGATPT
jgi:hypothetical protein